MHTLYAHSEQLATKNVRYKRRAYSDVVRYNCGMQLRIKKLRLEREWTVEHLAEIVGLSKSYVSEIENGKKQANQARIQKFADAFGVPVFELLDDNSLSKGEREVLAAYSAMGPKAQEALRVIAQNMLNKS